MKIRTLDRVSYRELFASIPIEKVLNVLNNFRLRQKQISDINFVRAPARAQSGGVPLAFMTGGGLATVESKPTRHVKTAYEIELEGKIAALKQQQAEHLHNTHEERMKAASAFVERMKPNIAPDSAGTMHALYMAAQTIDAAPDAPKFKDKESGKELTVAQVVESIFTELGPRVLCGVPCYSGETFTA
jgi:hypothetical protein